MSTMAKGDDIQERMVRFAVNIIKCCDLLPNTKAANHLAGQILRSGTSPAPNYGEARGAESKNDFIHKLGVILKELNETKVWLNIIQESSFLESNVLEPLLSECIELSKIINSSVLTAKKSR